MNSGGDNGQSPPLPGGGEFLLSLLNKPPDPSFTVRSSPIQSNAQNYSHLFNPQNPNTSSNSIPALSPTFQKLGLHSSKTQQGNNPMFDRFSSLNANSGVYRSGDNVRDESNYLFVDSSESRQGNLISNRFGSSNCGNTRETNGIHGIVDNSGVYQRRDNVRDESNGLFVDSSETRQGNSISSRFGPSNNGNKISETNVISQFNGLFVDNSGVYRSNSNIRDESNNLFVDSSETRQGNLISNRFGPGTSGNPRGDTGKGNGNNGLSENAMKTGNPDIDMSRYRDHGDEINGLLSDLSRQGNWQFDRFNGNSRIPLGGGFQNPGSVWSNENEVNYRNLSSGGSNSYAGNYLNPASLSSGESNRYGANYSNSDNLSSEGSTRVSNGYESNYRHSINSGSSRVVNGSEASYRNSVNPSGIRQGYDGPNKALNVYNRALNGFDSDFSRFPSHSIGQGNISRTGVARQEAKQTPPGFSNKGTNCIYGHNVESGSNKPRNWGIKYEDEGVLLTGSALHSVSGFRMEESLSELHREINGNGENPTKNGDSDELNVRVDGSLDEEDGSGEKNHRMKRDKDYRSDTRGQRALAQWMRKSKKMIQCRRNIDMFNAPLLAIFDSLVPPEEEKMKQKQLLALLEKLVVTEWPGSRLLVYGSCANSFGVKKSDIDICLATKDTDVNKSEILLKLADILKAENLENVQALTHARVPIVKLMDPVTGISCDICVNNVLAVVNSKLLRDYAKIDGRLRQLAFIVKHWAKSRGVNETYHGTLSSYAYVLMCIHFLQQCRPAILPCLQRMDVTYNVMVENVECAFFDQVEKLAGFGTHNTENIAQLVWGFFRYWAYCHDYTHDVVSVRVGRIISKHDKDWTRRVGNDRHLICIEDPFETTHDLGRVVDKFSIKVLREEFERAAQILQFDPNPCVTLFEPYVRGSLPVFWA